jgi:peptide subunit release factor RF-3
MTGIVFKIQANMDPNHRDRIAFMRLASGKLTRGMKVKLVRTGKTVALNAPQFFFAQDRSIADEAYAGDVVGIPNHGLLRIGDTLTEGEDVVFTGVPSFAPEILRRVKRCSSWRRRASCSSSSRRTALRPSSASSAPCSSMCWQIGSPMNMASPSASSHRAMR